MKFIFPILSYFFKVDYKNKLDGPYINIKNTIECYENGGCLSDLLCKLQFKLKNGIVNWLKLNFSLLNLNHF